MIKIQSSIKTSLKRFVLFRGMFFAGIGAFIILFTGVFLPPQQLSLWGLPVFLVGIGLITFGLLPYRRICRLEINPNVILADEKEIIFRNKVIPRSEIKKISYIEKGNIYGIEIQLKEKSIFLPYFTERALSDII